MQQSITRDLDQTSACAVVLAGGSGTRVQSLTRKIEGDRRPKQFCRILGGRSLLGDTRERLRPIFLEDRTVFVMTKAHEMFYTEELSDVDASRIVAQPLNRGTGVAVIVATLVRNQIEPEWLLKMRGSYLPEPNTNSRVPRRRRVGMIAPSYGVK